VPFSSLYVPTYPVFGRDWSIVFVSSANRYTRKNRTLTSQENGFEFYLKYPAKKTNNTNI